MTREEAIERLKENGTIRLSNDDGIDCREELIAIGVDIELVESALFQLDYLSCSIKYDGEYHLGEELEEEDSKLRDHLEKFGVWHIDDDMYEYELVENNEDDDEYNYRVKGIRPDYMAEEDTYNQLNLIKMDKETCKHEKTYVAVRHVSGIKLVKCSHCGKVIN